MFNQNLVTSALANEPLLLNTNLLVSSKITRAWQNVAPTATGTSGTNTLTTSSSLGNGVIAGMQLRIAGNDIYTISSVSGTTITTVEMLSTNYSGSVIAYSLISAIAADYLAPVSVSQATNSTRPAYVLYGMNNKPAFLCDSSGKAIPATSSSTIDDFFAGGATVFAAFYPRTIGEASLGMIFNKNSVYLSCSSGSVLRFRQDRGAGSQAVWDTVSTMTLNAVNIAAVTYDSSNPGTAPSIYLNSRTPSSLSAISLGTGSAASNVGNDLVLGSNAGLTTTFDGLIGFVSVHKRALSRTEISYNLVKLAQIYGGTIS